MRQKLVIIENNLISSLTMRDRLNRELMERYDLTILSTGNEDQKKAARFRGFNVVDIGVCKQNVFQIIRYLLKLRKAMRSIKPDLCLTFTIRPAIWGNLITRLLGIPTITTVTGTGPLFSTNNLPYRMARILYRFALRRTRRVFFQNTDDMGLFVENKFVRKDIVRVIPGSGVDSGFFKPAPLQSNAKFRFLFIGRLVKDKGILEFVQAAELLKQKKITAEFQVLGPFWHQNLKNNTVTPEEMKIWSSSGAIQYLGEAQDVRPYVASSDCVVLPSYREGLNNVLLEASCMERPCITTDTTGCREIVEDGITGLLCEVKSAESLAAKMEIMLTFAPEQRLEMGRKGRRKVIREFDKKIVINAYLDEINRQLDT